MHFTDGARIIRRMRASIGRTPPRQAAWVLAAAMLPGLAVAQAPLEPRPAVPSATLSGNPYGALVPVPDESQKSRDMGLRLALIQVLRNAVGRSDVATSPILDQAPRLVQKYMFVRAEGAETPQFRAEFDPAAVEAALRAQGLPVFGIDPDVIEAWAVQVRGLHSAADYSRALRHFTRIRGVRQLQVDGLDGDRVTLRMVVEGGLDHARSQALEHGVMQMDETGHYVLLAQH